MNNFKLKHLTLKAFVALFSSCIYFLANAQTVSTVAGAAGGFADGIVSKVKFNNPGGLTTDSFKNVYVADFTNNRIRKITPAGIVTTFAGNGVAGHADGMGANATFNGPIGLATDTANNIYVADQQNHLIRKITPAGLVTTVAGNGIHGKVEGPAANAEFYYPTGLAIDSLMNIYVSEYGNNCIRKISAVGIVSTYAGSIPGHLDGTGANARFNGPVGIIFDSNANLYVAESYNYDIRKITPSGVVSTFAGAGFAGYGDGIGTNAKFNGTAGLTIDIQNNLFMGDPANNRIRKISPFQEVTTLTGNDTLGFVDGNLSSAKFSGPWGVTIDKNGNIYTSDLYNNSIRKISAGIVTTIAGNGANGFEDGAGNNPEFLGPNSVASDLQGNLYVAELSNQRIRKITPTGLVTTIAGNGIVGLINGQGTAAEFHNPSGIALDVQKNIYVADALNHCIRKIDTTGLVTTFAGNGTAGFADGTGISAQFNHPNRITLDAQGNVYVADIANYCIRKITPQGLVTTIAGNGIGGFADGPSTSAQFNYPDGVAVDNTGNVYVADYFNNRVRKITTNGIVTTLAGNGVAGYINGAGSNAEFNNPAGIAINTQGDLYIADENGNRIRKVTSTGVVSLYAGNGTAGYIDTTASIAEFNNPRGICVDNAGNVYVPDFNNNRIRKITAGSVLPITLINFNVQLKDRDANLTWQTVTEEKSSYFNIQRSINGSDFNNVGKVPVRAAINSNTVKNYSYTDFNITTLLNKILYYRLQEVDIDGAITLSKVQILNFKNGSYRFYIAPNPINNFINVFSNLTVSNSKITITDMSGKILYTTIENLTAGNQLTVRAGKLPKGTFIVTIQTASTKSDFKIVKN